MIAAICARGDALRVEDDVAVAVRRAVDNAGRDGLCHCLTRPVQNAVRVGECGEIGARRGVVTFGFCVVEHHHDVLLARGGCARVVRGDAVRDACAVRPTVGDSPPCLAPGGGNQRVTVEVVEDLLHHALRGGRVGREAAVAHAVHHLARGCPCDVVCVPLAARHVQQQLSRGKVIFMDNKG